MKALTDKDFSLLGIEKSAPVSALNAQKGAYFRRIVGQNNLETIFTELLIIK